MKRFVVFLFFAVFLFSTIFAQNSYVSMGDCQNDTVKYIETNFRDNKERYIGQPFSLFSNDMEFDLYVVKSFIRREPNEKEIWGLKLMYINPGNDYYFFRDKRLYYNIYLEFERPYLKTDEEWDKLTTYQPAKVNYSRSFFADCIIKDIALSSGLDENDPYWHAWKEARW